MKRVHIPKYLPTLHLQGLYFEIVAFFHSQTYRKVHGNQSFSVSCIVLYLVIFVCICTYALIRYCLTLEAYALCIRICIAQIVCDDYYVLSCYACNPHQAFITVQMCH